MRIAVKFGYDGRKFHGFARQPQLKTVEGELIKALIKEGFIEDTSKSNFRYASRTDKGVTAISNVIAFDTDSSKDRIIHLLNDDLDDIENSREYNFKAGIIAGFMKSVKKDHKCNYYFAHEDNKWPDLRCSDIKIYDRYREHRPIKAIVNDIIQAIKR